MNRCLPPALCCVALLAATPCLAEKTPVVAFRAGAATCDITPPPGLPLWGYGLRKDLPASGTHDPLRASAVVLEAGEKRMAIVGLDLGRAPARKTTARIRERVKSESRVETIFLVASHTHHGPCLELETVAPTSTYIDTLVDSVARLVATAAKDLRPAELSVSRAEVDFNRNRHTKRDPKPVDRDLIAIRLTTPDGAPIATLVNFAAHPTTREASVLEYSADYPGPLKDAVEKRLGGVCVFLQGACGDLSTRRGGRNTEAYGVELARQVAKLVGGAKRRAPGKPSIVSHREEFTFSSRVDLADPLVYLKYCIAFFKPLVDAYVEEYEPGIRPELGVAVLNGDIALVSVSGELFCEHALRLKGASPIRHTLLLGYCNGYHQYFPTRRAVEEGGYGADPDVAPAEVGSGEAMVERALDVIESLRTGKTPSRRPAKKLQTISE